MMSSIDEGHVFKESNSSGGTEVVFVVLAVLFLLLAVWRARSSFGLLAIVFLFGFLFFVFYSLNYRTLIVLMNREALVLRFGVFSWTVPWASIDDAFVDETSLVRIGGAGIHFTVIKRRYRMYWNFLEFPRVVLALKKPRGWVRDVAFTTRRPAEVLAAISRFKAPKKPPEQKQAPEPP